MIHLMRVHHIWQFARCDVLLIGCRTVERDKGEGVRMDGRKGTDDK